MIATITEAKTSEQGWRICTLYIKKKKYTGYGTTNTGALLNAFNIIKK